MGYKLELNMTKFGDENNTGGRYTNRNLTILVQSPSELVTLREILGEIIKDEYDVCCDSITRVDVHEDEVEDTNGLVLKWEKE